jgi:glycosyltransferase involved in cell wall biosynthesis
MHGKGDTFLKHNFEVLLKQTFQDFDVVVSDNAKTDIIKKVCDAYKNKLTIHYFRNPDIMRGMSTNVNNAIKNATGELIKILFLDDYLLDENSLAEIVNAFDLKKDKWLVSGYHHTEDGVNFSEPRYAYYNDNVYLGENTIGSPSAITLKNENPLFFDVRLKWFMDCDYYKRVADKYGPPKVLNKLTVTIRKGKHQVTTNEITDELAKAEHNYLVKKHNPKSRNKNLKNVTLVAVCGVKPAGGVRALQLSMDGIDYYDVMLIAHEKPENLDPRITFRQCRPEELKSKDPKNKDDYSKFMAYTLANYIDSDYVLIVHNDAFVLRPEKWQERFLDYDYLGAPWVKDLHYTNEGVNVRIGNGGFSLRSKRMLNILNELNLPFTDNGTGYYNEDGILSVYYRKALEDAGIKYPPVRLAAEFSREQDVEETDLEPFGFHNNKKAIPRFYFFKHFLRNKLHLPL